jgi:ubiquinone/menaquinone biosynthesis C-methylase UbiE
VGGAHPLSAGFAAVADAYERARPTYARPAIEWLAERTELGAGRVVVDLAAGTGKLTRALVETGARVVAVEPIAAMRAKLVEALPAVQALDGAAEAIPLADATADLVTVGQAFHWFRHEEALSEVARVLRPKGSLALLWNNRDLQDPLHRALEGLFAPYRARTPLAREFAWRDSLEASPLFGPVEHHATDNPHMLTRAGLRDRLVSTSFIAEMDGGEREALLARADALVPYSEEPFPFPYVTEVFLTRRVPSNEGS